MAESPSLPSRRSLRNRLLRYSLMAGLAGLFVLFAGFLAFVYSLDRFEQKPETRADGIVAMTGGAQRIGDAIDLLAQGYAKRLLISGVNEKTSRDEIFRLNPGQRRLFDCCVDLDYRARNTIGNAIETRRWAEQHQFDALIVVTSNYHMPRTLVELDHALPNLQKIPYPVAATIDPHDWWHNPATAKVIFSEYLKFLVVWVRTRLEKDPEHSSAAKIMSGGRPIQHVSAGPLWR
ncbi:YdcF family protein [Microvirga puerhi]|uniref:YdcF family protein n=1 Tax=Microvirga puerhi TaxID=2876078 RepID=A0ABS7VQ73_9HYPH|nr:YdcF family protein [Microvirga puerhi]MBZ6077702.1 YdcF family protein [Microvirga puerhi]